MWSGKLKTVLPKKSGRPHISAQITTKDSSMAPPRLGFEASWGAKKVGNGCLETLRTKCSSAPVHQCKCYLRQHPCLPPRKKAPGVVQCQILQSRKSLNRCTQKIHLCISNAFGHSSNAIWFCPFAHMFVQRHGKQSQRALHS